MSTTPVHVFELGHPIPTAAVTPVVCPPNTHAEYADVVPQEMRPCLWWDWQLDTATGSFYPFCTLCQRYADQGHLESRLHCRHMADHNKTMPSWSSWKQLGPGYAEMTGIDASKAPKPASTFCVPPPPVEPSPPPLPCTTNEIEDNVLVLLYFATKEWSVQAGILTEPAPILQDCSARRRRPSPTPGAAQFRRQSKFAAPILQDCSARRRQPSPYSLCSAIPPLLNSRRPQTSRLWCQTAPPYPWRSTIPSPVEIQRSHTSRL